MEGLDSKSGEYLTDRLTDEALRFIETSRDRPFLLYLSHFAVHDPIQGRKDLVKKYEAKLPVAADEPSVLEGNPDAARPLSADALRALLRDDAYRGFRVFANGTVKIKQRQDNVQFAAMVEAMDQSLGRVRARLGELGLADNTIIVFTSDNGGMSAANFGRPDRVIRADQLDAAYSTANLPLRGGKGWLYEGGIRVPLIIHSPQQKKHPAICHEPVISTDLYPSILDLIGIQKLPQQHADGVSLAPLLAGNEHLNRDGIFWHFPHYSNHGMQSPGGAIRAGEFKLLEYFENGTVQLFNLRTDIGETRDLAREEPETAARLRGQLHRWRETVAAQSMQPNPEYEPSR
jgi:arylsulfatase A